MMSSSSPSRQPVRAAARSAGSSPSRKSPGKSPRKSSSLPLETVEYLKNWIMSPEHIAHPYPTEQEKAQIMADTGIEMKQLTNWFVNNRKRFWKPRVEARLHQQAQSKPVLMASSSSSSSSRLHVVSPSNQNRENSPAARPSPTAPYLALDMTRPANTSLPKNVSFVSCDTLAEFAASGKPRAVSVTSGSGLESDDSSLSSESVLDTVNNDEDNTVSGLVKRVETVDVHVLRPANEDELPILEDVSTLPSIPSNRILKTYRNCTITYQFPAISGSEKKKIQSRRDAEVVRVKKHYLKRFLSQLAESERTSLQTKKRAHPESTELRRPKYQRQCITVWKEACLEAEHGYDTDLPSLEEAAKLFGFEG